MNPVRALSASLGLFTVVPVPPLSSIDRATARAAVLALPWVGCLLGVVPAAALLAVSSRTGSSWLGPVVGVALLAALSGGLHLDGLADTADGLGSRRAPVEALAVMKRSDIGPMGVLTLVFVLLVDMAALAALPPPWTAAAVMALFPCVGRVSTVFATRPGIASARPGGFGALVAGVTSPISAWTTVACVSAVLAGVGWLLNGPQTALGLVAAAGAALLLAGWWRGRLTRRLGGMTGDTYGALIEVTQAAFVLASVLLLA